MEILFLCSKLVYIFFTYTVDIEINGISPDQMLFFTGTYTIMVAVYTGLFMDNFYRISAYVNDGTMDIYITKPVFSADDYFYAAYQLCLAHTKSHCRNYYDCDCCQSFGICSEPGKCNLIYTDTPFLYHCYVLLFPHSSASILLDDSDRVCHGNSGQKLGFG